VDDRSVDRVLELLVVSGEKIVALLRVVEEVIHNPDFFLTCHFFVLAVSVEHKVLG